MDFSNIQEEFTQISQRAEQGYISHLSSHYHKVVDQLTQKKSLLDNTMTTLQVSATHEEKTAHLDMLTKTDENVRKFQNELEKGKKRKLDTITQPASKKRKKQQPVQATNSNENTSVMVSLRTPTRPLQPPPTPTYQTPMNSLLNLTFADLLTGIQRQTPQLQPQPEIATPHPLIQLQPQGNAGQSPHSTTLGHPQLPQIQPHVLYSYTPSDGQSPLPFRPGKNIGLGRQQQIPQTISQNFSPPGRLLQQQP